LNERLNWLALCLNLGWPLMLTLAEADRTSKRATYQRNPKLGCLVQSAEW